MQKSFKFNNYKVLLLLETLSKACSLLMTTSLFFKSVRSASHFKIIRSAWELLANDTRFKHGFSSNNYCHFDFFSNSVVCLSRDMRRHKSSIFVLNFIVLLLFAHWPTCCLSFPIQTVVIVLMLFKAPCNIFLFPVVLPVTAHKLETSNFRIPKKKMPTLTVMFGNVRSASSPSKIIHKWLSIVP